MSTTSWGSLLAGEEFAVGVSGEAPPKSTILQIFARSRYQIILMSSSIAVGTKNGNQLIKRGAEWRMVGVPGSEDVGVFVGIVSLF